MENYKDLIENQMKIVKNSQMTKEEYYYISSFLGDKNFLVFGTGYDSNLWRISNSKGKTIFLENKKEWIKGEDDVYLIEYTTKLNDYKILLDEYKKGIFDKLEINIPNFIKETNWDFIFVDSPEGWLENHPGRMQSIYTAMTLCNNNTEIFIHDCDREVENLYSKTMFSVEIKKLHKLKHFKK
jgi:uncharacterized protein (TIGR01627 family)